MKNLFSVDFAANAIIATKTTLKKASTPNSPEYKALAKLIKLHPTFTIAEKEIKMKAGKATYKGLTDSFIESYISLQKNADDLREQHKKAAAQGKFPLVRKWFLNTFKDFNMEQAKREIEKAQLAEIAAIIAPNQKIADFPTAANM